MKLNKQLVIPGTLVMLTTISGFLLASTITHADGNTSTVDTLNITVNSACTMKGGPTGESTTDNTYQATIEPGTYQEINGSRLVTLCNDNLGYSIYAIGYSGDSYDSATHTDLIGASDIGNISTGTSGTNSYWAMKLEAITSPTPLTPPTILNSFDNYHVIPNTYTQIAKQETSTAAPSDDGASVQTKYKVNISSAQTAGAYTGKVKYTMVHPNDANAPVNSNQIGINYHSNGLSFADGSSSNVVVYEPAEVSAYIATTPMIAKSTNIADDGTQNESFQVYTDPETGDTFILADDTVNASGAVKMKIRIKYDAAWVDGVSIKNNDGEEIFIQSDCENDCICNGESTYIMNGDRITVKMYPNNTDAPITGGHDYGFYAQVYPIYENEQPNTEATTVDVFTNKSGTYVTTTIWNNKWYMIDKNDEVIWFESEAEVKKYMERNSESLSGTTLDLYAYNPYIISYDGNNATAGTMNGFTTHFDTSIDQADLMAPNFKKDGYGFAGWSKNPNATVNSNDKIYGPNETLKADDLSFTYNDHNRTLYAVWVPSSGNLQDFSCSSLSYGKVTALTDTRDNNVYTVGKMQDGKCWMMENLRLDSQYSSDSSKAQGFGGVFVGLADSEDSSFGTTNPNSLYNTTNITGNDKVDRFPRYNNNNTNIGGTNSLGTTLIVSPGLWDGSKPNDEQEEAGNNDHVQWYGYGNYYTLAAAKANTDDYVYYANTSICPKGWTLPDEMNYLKLRQVIGNKTQWRNYPNNYVYSGTSGGKFYHNYSDIYDRGKTGRYWTTDGAQGTSGGKDYAPIEINHSRSRIENNYGEFGRSGLAVRCVEQ